MRILGLIPARGGSKGIPRKNSKLLGDKPLVSYSIASGLACPVIDQVVVSTDDAAIAEVSEAAGARVPFIRPAALANDTSPTIDTVLHALHFLQDRGEHYDAICLLQPTVPFRHADDLTAAIQTFIDKGADSLISVRAVPKPYHPDWVYTWNADGQGLRLANGGTQPTTRRQDLSPAYHRDGSIYLTKSNVLLEQKSLYGAQLIPYEMTQSPAINIDTPADWLAAENFLHHQSRSHV